MTHPEPVTGSAPLVSTWEKLRAEAEEAARAEPILAGFLNASILSHPGLAAALAYHLARKLGDGDLNALQLRGVFQEAFADDPHIVARADRDLVAVFERDPAVFVFLQPFLYFKGYQALQTWRAAHYLWARGRRTLAIHLQSLISERFDVDIHPAAKIGAGVMIDHATGVVIGETAEVGDDCSLLHGVTLGGTGAKGGDRHPKIGRGVLIGAGAKVLGNIRIGDEARIAAGSVVLHDVRARCTVAGVPAKPVGDCAPEPARRMDHRIEDEE
jgi:serine O-acetyltransferase